MLKKYLIAIIAVSITISLILTFKYDLILFSCSYKKYPNERLNCLVPYFKHLTQKTSAENAINTAKQFQKDGIINDCHLAAHIIGAENLRKNNFDAGKSFATCPMACIEGCYHGVMEEYMRKTGDTFDPGRLSKLCENISDNPLLKRQCIHGIGHGILRHNEIPLIEAIGLCQTFSDSFLKNTCLEGVFMQNINNILLDDEQTFIKKIPDLCKSVESLNDKGLENQCVSAIGEGIMFYTGHDLDKSKKICLTLPVKNQKQCILAAEAELKINRSVLD